MQSHRSGRGWLCVVLASALRQGSKFWKGRVEFLAVKLIKCGLQRSCNCSSLLFLPWMPWTPRCFARHSSHVQWTWGFCSDSVIMSVERKLVTKIDKDFAWYSTPYFSGTRCARTKKVGKDARKRKVGKDARKKKVGKDSRKKKVGKDSRKKKVGKDSRKKKVGKDSRKKKVGKDPRTRSTSAGAQWGGVFAIPLWRWCTRGRSLRGYKRCGAMDVWMAYAWLWCLADGPFNIQIFCPTITRAFFPPRTGQIDFRGGSRRRSRRKMEWIHVGFDVSGGA